MTDKSKNISAGANRENCSVQKHHQYPSNHQQSYCKSAVPNVLIVDDCTSTLLLLGHYALLRSFRIWTAPTGEVALDLAKRQSFDLVFMDISLPGIDGIETIHCMTEMETISLQTQFIICSGYTPLDLGQQQFDYVFLHKPICRKKFNQLMDDLENKQPLPAMDEFDDTILSSIFDEADDQMKYRICTELYNDINRHVNNMLTADTQQDLTAFERATHALKGVSGTFGAMSLHNLAHQGNQMARNANPDEAFNLATKIEASALFALENIQRFFMPEKQPTAQPTGQSHD